MRGEALTLALWEGAAGRRGAQRESALLDAAPHSLPERNLLALRRYASLFGPALELVGRCAHCKPCSIAARPGFAKRTVRAGAP